MAVGQPKEELECCTGIRFVNCQCFGQRCGAGYWLVMTCKKTASKYVAIDIRDKTIVPIYSMEVFK